jgi:hemerythrin-like domain-containing protein
VAEDAITQLKNDHRALLDLFDQFEQTGPRAHKKMTQLRDKIVASLSVHAAIEERLLYPLTIEQLPDQEPKVLEAIQEHAVAEQLLSQVASLSSEDRWFRPKMKVMMEGVRHHIKEEERELFPALRKRFSKAELVQLAEDLDGERATAPRVPPPSAQVRGLLENVSDRVQTFAHALTAPIAS